MTTATPPHQAKTPDDAATGTALLHVLIADKMVDAGLNGLDELGCHTTYSPDLTADTLAEAIAEHDPDILVVRSTKVKAPAIAAAKRLCLIVRAGAGYDNVDVAEASNRSIFVANCPGKNAIAVAELAWAHILCCDRRVPDQTIDLRNGTWDKKKYSKAKGIYGRTLGIVGLGRIGQEVAARGEAFGMRIVAWSRSLTQERADELGVGYCSSLINLAKMADVVSVNVAANADTAGLIGEQFFQSMKDGAYLINTSRGSVVDSDALKCAVRDRGIRAGLDVYANQPGTGTATFEDPIVNEPMIYGTHHCGASTDQAQIATAEEVVRVIRTYQGSGLVPNCVNRAASTSATTLMTVRHLNRPGVLAHVFYTLGQAGINVEEMENIIYDGQQAACARIQLDAMPSEEHTKAIASNDSVLSVDVSGIN